MIEKYNTYTSISNIQNMADNVSLQMLRDKLDLSIDTSESPALVTILQGSIIHCNHNRYIFTSDYQFAMRDAGHNYLIITDSPTTVLSSAATRGIYDAEKGCYYQIDGLTKTLDVFIDQTSENYVEIIDAGNQDTVINSQLFDYVYAGTVGYIYVPGVIPMSAYYDALGNYDNANDRFVCDYPGYYFCSLMTRRDTIISAQIRVNGASVIQGSSNGRFISKLVLLNKDDYVDAYTVSHSGGYYASMFIIRIL